MKLSTQAATALMMTLQKCLSEQSDIMELLGDWELTEKDGELFDINPPTVKTSHIVLETD